MNFLRRQWRAPVQTLLQTPQDNARYGVQRFVTGKPLFLQTNNGTSTWPESIGDLIFDDKVERGVALYIWYFDARGNMKIPDYAKLFTLGKV